LTRAASNDCETLATNLIDLAKSYLSSELVQTRAFQGEAASDLKTPHHGHGPMDKM